MPKMENLTLHEDPISGNCYKVVLTASLLGLPLSRRAYKSGGKILGEELKRRADRRPRKTGGRALIDDWVNSDVKDANEDRGGVFAFLNLNKRGVTLNLKHERGRELLAGLLDSADLLIENFAPGTLAALGLAPDDLIAKFPRLSVISISNFGQDGPDDVPDCFKSA